MANADAVMREAGLCIKACQGEVSPETIIPYYVELLRANPEWSDDDEDAFLELVSQELGIERSTD